jgi:glycosyltransferase involved in cell wall biosynthesis
MAEILTNAPMAQEMSTAGLEQSRKFTWENFAGSTANIYREALSQ